MEGFWYIFFLAVVLKIPVLGAMALIWWAIRAVPETEDETPPKSDDHHFRRWRRTPLGPKGPRRGPHGGQARALPPCPAPRTRTARQPAPKRVTTHSLKP